MVALACVNMATCPRELKLEAALALYEVAREAVANPTDNNPSFENISMRLVMAGLNCLNASTRVHIADLRTKRADVYLLDALEARHKTWVVTLFCGGLYLCSPLEIRFYPNFITFVHEYSKLLDEIETLDEILLSREKKLRRLVSLDPLYYRGMFEEVNDHFIKSMSPWWYKLIS